MTVAVMAEHMSSGLWEMSDDGRENRGMLYPDRMGLSAQMKQRLDQWITDLYAVDGERWGEDGYEVEGHAIAVELRTQLGAEFDVLYVGTEPITFNPIAFRIENDGSEQLLYRGIR